MKYIKSYLFFILFTLIAVTGFSQKVLDSNLVQFSGIVLDGMNEKLFPIPYSNVFVPSKGVGTYTDLKGFFTIVVEKGDRVEFSGIGYKTVYYTIPDTLKENRYSLVQLMTQDTFNLPETIVFPWPSKEHFREEFLAMDVSAEMQAYSASNVAEKSLRQIQEQVPWDGNENADYYLREQSKATYYSGQAPPMNIFNPLAWSKFFSSWKKGNYKKGAKDRKPTKPKTKEEQLKVKEF